MTGTLLRQRSATVDADRADRPSQNSSRTTIRVIRAVRGQSCPCGPCCPWLTCPRLPRNFPEQRGQLETDTPQSFAQERVPAAKPEAQMPLDADVDAGHD